MSSPARTYSKREAFSAEEQTSTGHTNGSSVLNRPYRFETPPRGAKSVTKPNSPTGVDDLDEQCMLGREHMNNNERESVHNTRLEQDIQEAAQGIAQLRNQVEQMRIELDEVRKKRKDHIARSREELKALIEALKDVEDLRNGNSRMTDEIQVLESSSHNF